MVRMQDKLKIEIEKSGLTYTKLAEKIGVQHSWISNILSGKRNLTDEKAKDLLTKGLGYSAFDALGLIAKWRIEEYADVSGINIPDNAIPMAENFEYIPLLAKVSCGDGIDMDSIMEGDEYEALVPVPKEYIFDKKKTFAFTAVGDSMNPEILNDDTVIVEYTKELMPSKIHLIKYGNEFMFGRIVQTAEGYEIDKANRSHPSIRIPSGNEFEICGFVRAVLNLRIY